MAKLESSTETYDACYTPPTEMMVFGDLTTKSLVVDACTCMLNQNNDPHLGPVWKHSNYYEASFYLQFSETDL
jgi:hypothetical protein